MGQMTLGILYGCEAPKLPETDSDEPLHDLICRWGKANRIKWDSRSPKVRNETEGGKDLLGVWVAVGASGEDGAADLDDACMPLSYVPVAFAKNIAKAAKLWARFAAWVLAKEGITLAEPVLWLTPCEVA